MKKLLTSKWFVIIMTILVLIVIIVMSFIPGSPIKSILKPIGLIVNPIQKFVRDMGSNISYYFAAVDDGISIRKENEDLRTEIAELEYRLLQNEEAQIRYEELKDALHIKDSFSNFEIFGASVISREADEWFSIIRIDLTTSDIEIESNDSLAVVDVRNNLVGRIIEIEPGSSRVLPLNHEGFAVSGKVNEVNGALLVISGDTSLRAEGLCLVTGIGENVILEEGTEIVTSGEGGLFPQGIPIGTIESVDYSNPVSVTATLRPYSSIEGMNDVFVMVPIEEETDITYEETSSEDDDS